MTSDGPGGVPAAGGGGHMPDRVARQHGAARAADLSVIDPTEDLGAVAPAPEDACAVQQAKVLRHRGLAHCQALDQIGHVAFAFHQRANDAQSGGGGQQTEMIRSPFVGAIPMTELYLTVNLDIPFNIY